MPTPLGAKIRELREAMDLSLREFAAKLGETSKAHISDIELGRRYPSDDLLRKMAKVLRIPYDDLQRFDARPPVDELRRRIEADPQLGFALRKMIDHEISAEALLDLIDRHKESKKASE